MPRDQLFHFVGQETEAQRSQDSVESTQVTRG